jgi:hypothetical protein
MTSDMLRRAATLIRERAEKATPGPWLVSDTIEGMWPPRPGWQIVNDAYLNPLVDDDELWLAVELHTGCEADAEHIAALHPAVALAAATWLEHEADRAEHQPWTDDVTEQALAFATAYLGEEME